VRYALSPYIKQISCFFKGLICPHYTGAILEQYFPNNGSHKEPCTATVHSVYITCVAFTNGICTVKCRLQFSINKARADTSLQPAYSSMGLVIRSYVEPRYSVNTCRFYVYRHRHASLYSYESFQFLAECRSVSCYTQIGVQDVNVLSTSY
jgi:hypothetical protein